MRINSNIIISIFSFFLFFLLIASAPQIRPKMQIKAGSNEAEQKWNINPRRGLSLFNLLYTISLQCANTKMINPSSNVVGNWVRYPPTVITHNKQTNLQKLCLSINLASITHIKNIIRIFFSVILVSESP